MNNTPNKSWDPAWEAVFSSQEWGKYPPEHVIRFIARHFYPLPERPSVRILDLGCGPGACTWYMAREGFSVYGIDGSATAIRQANERLCRENLTADLRVGDYLELPWSDQFFDAVIDNGALCCNRFAACRLAIEQVSRVLKPGGHFLSCNFTDRSWGCGKGREVEAGGFVDIQEGPLVGKGFILFMSRSQVDELYRPFKDVKIERISWTARQMRELIEFWIVEAC